MNCKGFFTVIFLLDLYFFSPLEQLAASSSSAAVTADCWRWWENADEKDVIERKTIKKHKHKHTSIVEQILPDSSCLSLSFILNIEQKTSKCLIKRCFLFPLSLVRPSIRSSDVHLSRCLSFECLILKWRKGNWISHSLRYSPDRWWMNKHRRRRSPTDSNRCEKKTLPHHLIELVAGDGIIDVRQMNSHDIDAVDTCSYYSTSSPRFLRPIARFKFTIRSQISILHWSDQSIVHFISCR